MGKPLSTVRKLMAEYKMGFVVGDKDIDAHYDAFEAQLRTLVEKFAEELIGMAPPCEPECSDVRHAYHQGGWDLTFEQRENVPKLIDQMFGGRDE